MYEYEITTQETIERIYTVKMETDLLEELAKLEANPRDLEEFTTLHDSFKSWVQSSFRSLEEDVVLIKPITDKEA